MKVRIVQKPLQEGDMVKLHLKNIRSSKDYPKLSRKYKEFIQANKDTVFTIERPTGRLSTWKTVWSLKEDTSEPKWGFYEQDLVRVVSA